MSVMSPFLRKTPSTCLRCQAKQLMRPIEKKRAFTIPTLLRKELRLPPRPQIPETDLEESFLRGSGPGGQKINKTSSAVQLKHLPTGIVVKCQSTRSRDQNRRTARKLLGEKLEFMEQGDESRVAMKAAVKAKRKASKTKKARRKYKRKEEEDGGAGGKVARSEEGAGGQGLIAVAAVVGSVCSESKGSSEADIPADGLVPGREDQSVIGWDDSDDGIDQHLDESETNALNGSDFDKHVEVDDEAFGSGEEDWEDIED